MSDDIRKHAVVVLGGGLAGVATAITLADAGVEDITIVERGATLGGLAGSFEREGHFYPLGYHHILHRDRPLLYFLDRLGALERVRWRRIRMLFNTGRRSYDLGSPGGFASFPLPLSDKIRFLGLMLRAFGKSDWTDWEGHAADELLDRHAGARVREALFEPLCQLKFELPARDVSAAWLGARLHYREGSAPFGYIPGANWTKVLCDGVTDIVAGAGASIRLRESATRLHAEGDRLTEVELAGGERIRGDLFVSAIPTEVFLDLVPRDETPNLEAIRYSALISVVCATKQSVSPDFYWMNLAGPGHTAAGIFQLNSLNPTIGEPGDSCFNFVTHLRSRHRELFSWTDEQLISAYSRDFESVFGKPLDPFWVNVARVPMYSPVFRPEFRNPPIRSSTWSNLYFAGNYRTFPSIVSTGTALASGVAAGELMLADQGMSSRTAPQMAAFRLRGKKKG